MTIPWADKISVAHLLLSIAFRSDFIPALSLSVDGGSVFPRTAFLPSLLLPLIRRQSTYNQEVGRPFAAVDHQQVVPAPRHSLQIIVQPSTVSTAAVPSAAPRSSNLAFPDSSRPRCDVMLCFSCDCRGLIIHCRDEQRTGESSELELLGLLGLFDRVECLQGNQGWSELLDRISLTVLLGLTFDINMLN